MSLQTADAFTALRRLLDAPSTSAGTVRKACVAVEECISTNRDNLRAFFELCFPLLLKRVFGFDFDASWLNVVTKAGREADCAALLGLLSPTGRLFDAIRSADADQLVRFAFPLERLPVHTQELLKTAPGRHLLATWPQYAGRIVIDPNGRTNVFLPIYEFFVFWNAIFVLRGGGGRATMDASSGARDGGLGTAGRSDSPGWPHVPVSLSGLKRSLVGGFHGSAASSLDGHPYFALLQQHLAHWLPQAAATGGAASGASTTPRPLQAQAFQAAHSPASPTLSASGTSSLGAVLLSVLVEFWMTDTAEPLPEAADGSGNSVVGGATRSSPPPGARPTASNPLRVLAFQPPAEEVLLGAALLVQHVHVTDAEPGTAAGLLGGHPAAAQPHPAQAGTPWLVETPVRTLTTGLPQRPPPLPPPTALLGGPSCAAVQAVSRKVYRLLRRTIAQWPLASSASLLPAVNLWLSVITPWVPLAATQSQGAVRAPRSSESGATPGYPPGPAAGHKPAWQEGMSHLGSEISHRLGSLGGRLASQGGDGAGPPGPSRGQAFPYTPEWRGHVLSHLPFYLHLIPRFLELCVARLSYRGDAAAGELLVLLRALDAAGPALGRLLQDAEIAFNRYLEVGRKPGGGALAEVMPWAVEQARDWEAAATAGTPTNPPMQALTQGSLFSLAPNGAPYYGAAILRAAETQVRPELRDALAAAMQGALPGVASMSATQEPQAAAPLAVRGAQYPKAGSWAALHYKGDWLTRPIASNEVAVLVRLMVAVSQALNRALGLDVAWRGDDAEEPPETVVHQGLAWLRRRGYRISLRFLAEVQVIAWLVILYFVFRFCVAFYMA